MTIKYLDSKRIVDTATFEDSYWQLHTSKLVNMGSSLGNEGTGAWTQAVWHKADDTNSVTVYEKYTGSPDNGFFLAGSQGSNGYYWVDYGVLQINSGVSPSVGNWDHVVITRSSGGAFTIYVNGVSRATGNSTSDIDLSSDFRFATHASGQSNIADFSLWQRELTASEVLTLYNTSKIDSISQTNLTHHYDFAQTGSTLTDQVGSINGTRTGATGVLTRDVDNIKPTNVQDNSILIEKDTVKRYWFDSGLAPTYVPSLTSSTNWLATNNSSSDKITLDTTAGEVDIIATRDGNWNSLTYNLGSALSNTEWVVRARINITDLTAGNQAWFFMGMSKVPSSTDISGEGSGSTTDSCLGFIMYESTYKRFGLTGGNDRKAVSNPMGYDTLGFTPAEDTYYYVELKRTSDSEAIFTVRTGSHEGTIVQSKTNTGNLAGASDLQYLGFYMMKDNASGGAFVTEVDQITIHNAVTSVTPATWINSTWDVQDDFSSYTTQTQADTAWIPASTSQARVNITDNDIDYSFTVSATNGAIYNDVLGRTVSDTAFLYRYTIELATNTAGGGSYMAVGMASLPAMAGATTGNFLGNKTNRHPSVCGADKQHSAFDVYNNTMNNLDPYAHQSFCTPDMNVVFPYELTRLTSTTYQHVRFTDDTTAYDTAISTLSDTCDSSLKDLRYMTITNNSWGTGGSVVSGVFGNFKFIDGATTAP